jgi:predicted phage baseplate assembly protein
MFVPLPNLDDRRFTDLVDEGRALIPVYSAAWTDHNESDPGITIMELLAWIADGDLYRVNRVPEAHIRAFLALLGLAPEPPAPGSAPVQFLLHGTEKLLLPATVELSAKLLDGNLGKFRLQESVWVLPATLAAVQVQSGGKYRDITGSWRHAKPLEIFGSNPQPGDALYLGFEGSLQTGDILKLHLEFAGAQASSAGRRRILEELKSRQEACPPWVACGAEPPAPEPLVLPPHHSARVVWETQTQPGIWRSLDVDDGTRSMTLSGPISLTIAKPPAKVKTGAVAEQLMYIRCRLDSGSFDAAPLALRILENAAVAEQSSPLWEQWKIARGVVALGTPPAKGQPAWLRLSFDAAGSIDGIEFANAAANAIRVVVLDFKPATFSQPGALTVEAIRIGTGTASPNQLYHLKGPKLCTGSFVVYTLESHGAVVWTRVGSFVASGAAAADYVLDAGEASVLFGNGQNGRVPPASAPIIAVGRVTSGAAGNAAAGAINALDGGPHNIALLGDVAARAARLAISNPDAATGGEDEETSEHAEGRAVQLFDRSERGITLTDCKTLALETPGVQLVRAAAVANLVSGLQCYSAHGFITVVVVPSLPAGRPVPSPGLIGAVSAYLNRRRVIGTRIEVTGPDYLEVAVTASVKAVTGQNKAVIRDAVTAALAGFLDPLTGGPDRTGWPLGRGVYVSEILQTIAKVPGVDHVISLQLNAGDCGPQCGDICLAPLALTVSGNHQVQVS